jgi:hypothetical protein
MIDDRVFWSIIRDRKRLLPSPKQKKLLGKGRERQQEKAIRDAWGDIGEDPFADSSTPASRAEWSGLWEAHDAFMEKLRAQEEQEHRANCKLWRCSRCGRPKKPAPPISFSKTLLTLEQALDRLERVRRKPGSGGWMALCPAHDDHQASLYVSEHRHNSELPFFYCHAGCHPLEIINVLKGNYVHDKN